MLERGALLRVAELALMSRNLESLSVRSFFFDFPFFIDSSICSSVIFRESLLVEPSFESFSSSWLSKSKRPLEVRHLRSLLLDP